jgi:hypothetical protein
MFSGLDDSFHSLVKTPHFSTLPASSLSPFSVLPAPVFRPFGLPFSGLIFKVSGSGLRGAFLSFPPC